MKNKLLLLAAVLLTTLSSRAVTEIEVGMEYYILNVETGLFLGCQNNWGCMLTVSEDAGVYVFESPKQDGAPGYNLSNLIVTGDYHYAGTDCYGDKKCDISASLTSNEGRGTINIKDGDNKVKRVDGIWSVTPTGDGKFTIYCNSSWDADGKVETKYGYLTASETEGYKKGYECKFEEQLSNRAKFIIMNKGELMSYMTQKTETENISFNFLIKNPDFCRNQTLSAWTGYSQSGGDNGDFCAESYMKTFDSKMEVAVPNGNYVVKINAAVTYHDNRAIKPYVPGDPTPIVTVNGEEKAFFEMEEEDQLQSQAKLAGSFREGKYLLSFDAEVTNGVLTIDISSTRSDIWAVWDNIQLTNNGPVEQYSVITYAKELLDGITYPIEGLGNASVQSAYESAYSTFKNWVNNLTPSATVEEVDEHYSTFVAAENAWKASIEAWSPYSTAAEKAKKLYTQIASQEGKFNPSPAWHAFGVYIHGAAEKPGFEDAGYVFANGNYAYIVENRVMSDEAVPVETEFLNNLMTDVRTTVVQVGMDVTFLLTNPDFTDPSGAGWTRVQTGGNKTNYGGLTGWPVAEAWNASSLEFYQEVADAPVGLYKVSVNAFYRSAGRKFSDPVTVNLFMGSINSPIASLYNPDYLVENDLEWKEEQQQWIGTVAKNGTNTFYWDGNDWPAMSEADKEKIWTYNENEDLDIRNRIKTSDGIHGDGYVGHDRSYDPDTETEYEDGSGKYLVPDCMQGASIAFSAGRYPMRVYGEVSPTEPGGKTGTLRIGVKGNTSGAAWALWSNFRLELLGEDAEAMRFLLGKKLEELKACDLLPQEDQSQGVQEQFMVDTVQARISEYEVLADETTPLEEYAVYLAAHNDVEYMLNKLDNVYRVEIDKFYSTQADLEEIIGGFDGPQKVKDYATKVKAVYEAMMNRETGSLISLTNVDMENLIQYYVDGAWVEHPTVALTKDMIMKDDFDPADAEDYWYVSTYDYYYQLVEEIRMMMGSIYISVDTEATAQEPDDVTDQLRNPDFAETFELPENQWNGTAPKAIDTGLTGSAEWIDGDANVFDAYQPLWLPEGYYTFVSYAQDRRTSWKNAIEGADDNVDLEYATYMYANVGRGTAQKDTLCETTQYARYVALTTDITGGEGGESYEAISTYIVDPEGANVTWYTPNSMTQFNEWMDASRNIKNMAIGGKVMQFSVPAGGAYTSIGFYRRQVNGGSWFICDRIQLFYASDDYPTPTGVDALPASVENFGKADGKYMENDRIVIYSNGNKFNVAGQIIK